MITKLLFYDGYLDEVNMKDVVIQLDFDSRDVC